MNKLTLNKVVLIVVLLSVVSFIVFLYLGSRTQKVVTPPVTKPEVKFLVPDQLPDPNFNSLGKLNPSIQINNIIHDKPNQTTAKTYSIKLTKIDQNYASVIAKKLGFGVATKVLPDSYGSYLFVFQTPDGSKSLTIAARTGALDYANNEPLTKDPDNTNPSFLKDSVEAKSIAEQFLDNLGLTNQNIVYKNIEFLTGLAEPEPAKTPSLANIISVSFEKKINNFLLYTYNGDTSTGFVWIDKYKIIRKLGFQLNDISIESRDFPLIGFDDALAQVSKGQGEVVSLGTDIFQGKADIPNISTIDLLSSEYGYFLDTNNEITQPIYVFRGKATLRDKIIKDVVIYYDAVKNNEK